MKGLLYSDFVLNRITILLVAGYSIFIIAFTFYLTALPVLTGPAIIFYIIFLLLLWLNIGIIGISEFSKGKSRQFAITFPQGKKGYVLSKYIYCVLLTFIGIVCAGICLLSQGLDIKLGTILTIVNIGFIFLWFELAYILIFGEKFGASVFLVLLVTIVFFVTAYILFGDLTFLAGVTAEDVDAFFTWLGDNLAVYSTIGNIAVLVVTFPISCRFVSLDGTK